MIDRRIQRVHASRMRGKWSASAADGVRVGHGLGYSWESAVREALRELDDKHVSASREKR